ncbi:Acetyltransferase [Methanococcoides methylutens MM1]|uniref:Acetyltransferase n=2 Tax=Methanococcoides methylutens TaxID=2226 RepID=A0A0E3X0L0_METMT|nr:Acetyltransferase [Methanococcoides methylutens MM1]
MLVRKEEDNDYLAITEVNDHAFGQENEGRLVVNLRMHADFVSELSLVAEVDGRIVGHILFFPVKIVDDGKEFDTLSLAPMAVLPDFQRQGIGSALIKEGLTVAENLGYRSVVVLGHAEYYPRFGFRPASNWDIRSPFEDVPDDAFMAMELVDGSLDDVRGVVEYPEEFHEV